MVPWSVSSTATGGGGGAAGGLGAATGESDFPQPDTVKARASRSDAEKLRATAGKRKTQEEGMTDFLEGAAPSQDAAFPGLPPCAGGKRRIRGDVRAPPARISRASGYAIGRQSHRLHTPFCHREPEG